MKKIILTAAFVAVMTGAALAQNVVAVNIQKAKLTWAWSQGTGSATSEFRVKCGASTGVYTVTTPVTFPTQELAVKSAISGVGPWFCVVVAANQFGESAPSNEVSFLAGDVPGGATNLTVLAQ